MVDWTPPRVWVNGEHVTAASFNTTRDQLEFLKDHERVHCYNSQDEELKNSQWEVLRWDSENMDNNSMHSTERIDKNYGAPWSNAKNGSRDGNWPPTSQVKSARVTTRIGGIYLVILKVNFEANAVNQRKIQLRKNSGEDLSGGHGLGIWSEDATSSGQTSVFAKRFVDLDPHDHINAFAWQNSGGILDVMSGSATTFFQVLRMSA